MASERRTFDTVVRSSWNAPIHHMLKAIDNHTALYLQTGLVWHEDKATMLRSYVTELKTWIHAEEKKTMESHR